MEESTYDVIRCIGCGGPNTHHFRVWVKARDHGGQDCSGTLTRVQAEDPSGRSMVTMHRAEDEHRFWDGRRDSVTIELSCEDCDAITELLIQQHKGETQIYRREPKIEGWFGLIETAGPMVEG